MWCDKQLSIVFFWSKVLIVFLFTNAVCAHLTWRERIVQDEERNSQKLVLYERNNILSPRTEDKLTSNRHLSGFEIEIVAFCPATYFDNLPISNFLVANRIFFADDLEDKYIWLRHDGLLEPDMIVSLFVEQEVMLLLQDHTHHMHEFLPYETNDLSHETIEVCVEQYRLFSDIMVELIKHLLDSNVHDICGRKVTSLPPHLRQKLQSAITINPSFEAVAVWIQTYLDRQLNPYLSHPVYCLQDQHLRNYHNFSILTQARSTSLTDDDPPLDRLIVTDMPIPVLLPWSECLSYIHDSLPNTTTWHPSAVGCTMHIRDLYPVSLTEEKFGEDYRDIVESYQGGGSHTSTAWYCVQLDPLAAIQKQEKDDEKEEEKCFLAPSFMHAYMEMFVAAALPLSPVFRDNQATHEKSSPKLLNVGLGGGTIPNFFSAYHPEWTVDTLEINEASVSFFEQYFNGKHFLCDKQQFHNGVLTPLPLSIESTGSECRSRVILTDAFAYIRYLDTLGDEQAMISATYDMIFFDVFTSDIFSWSSEPYQGTSNIPLSTTITPTLSAIRRRLRPFSGLLCMHLHKDAQIPEFIVRHVIPVFGVEQVVVLEHGLDLLIVAGHDVFQPETYPHPCSEYTAFVDRVRTFRPPGRERYPWSFLSQAHAYDVDCTAVSRWRHMVEDTRTDNEEPAEVFEEVEEFSVDGWRSVEEDYADEEEVLRVSFPVSLPAVSPGEL